MAGYPLAYFFAADHRCDNWTLQRAVMRCAQGPWREILREAAYAWSPETHFHRTLRQIMIADDPPRLAGKGVARMKRGTHAGVTPAVTRVRKELEAWLGPLPKRATPPPLQIETPWDIFNATDRYSKDDIKGGIWHAMYGEHGGDDTWKADLQSRARWHTAATAWERELISFMLAKPHPDRPSPRTPRMYNIARRITAWLRKNSTFDQYQKIIGTW